MNSLPDGHQSCHMSHVWLLLIHKSGSAVDRQDTTQHNLCSQRETHTRTHAHTHTHTKNTHTPTLTKHTPTHTLSVTALQQGNLTCGKVGEGYRHILVLGWGGNLAGWQ